MQFFNSPKYNNKALVLNWNLLFYNITCILTAGVQRTVRKKAAVRQNDVLRVLNSQDNPMTAYQILSRMVAVEPDIAAPTVYRALTALTAQGRAHRLESIKSFVPCRCDHSAAVPVLTICDDCGSVDEHDGTSLLPALQNISVKRNFKNKRYIIEIHGECQQCTG